MRQGVAALLLLAACAAGSTEVADVLGCAGQADLQVCLDVEQSLRVHIGSCVEGGEFPAAGVSGQVQVRGAVDGGNRTILSASAYAGASVNVTCAGAVATLELRAAASVSGGLVGVAAASTDFRVRVGKVDGRFALEWDGTLLRADVGHFDGVSVGFRVGKAAFGALVQTELSLDIGDLGEHLGLPSQIVLNRDGLFFFDGELNVTCPFPAVAVEGSAAVYVAGLAGALGVGRVEADVCALLSSSRVGEPFLTVDAAAAHAVTLFNLSAVSASVRVTAVRTSVLPVKVEWAAELSAGVALFGNGVLAPATAHISTAEGLVALNVVVDVKLPGLQIGGKVSFTADACGPQNAGAVDVVVKGLGTHAISGRIAQRESCELAVTLQAQSIVHIVGASFAAAELAEVGGVWTGAFAGSVTLPGLQGSLAVHLAVDGEFGVTQIAVAGAVSLGPVSGTVQLTSQGEGTLLPLMGRGTLEYQGLLGASGFEARVAFTGAGWSVEAVVGKALLGGLWVKDGALQLNGAVGAEGGVAWQGNLHGTTVFAGVKVSVTAAFDGVQVPSVTGTLSVATGGLRYNGAVGFTTGTTDGKQCVVANGEGQLELATTGHVFAGSLLISRCAGELPKYTLTGVFDGVFRYQALELRDGVLALSGHPKQDLNLDLSVGFGIDVNVAVEIDWAGGLDATAHLFGGSAHAAISFVGGALGSVQVSTLFMAGNGLLSSRLDIAYVHSCDTVSRGVAATTLRLAGAAELAFNATVEYSACSGAVVLRGEHSGSWDGPGALDFGAGVSVVIQGGAHGGAAPLSSRTWTGALTAGKVGGIIGGQLAASVTFNTSDASASPFDASLKYSNKFVSLVAAFDGENCSSATGLLAVQNLPHGIPAVELEVSVSGACGAGFGVAGDWAVHGPLLSGELRIPYFGKTIRVQAPTVALRSVGGVRTLTISGAFLQDFGVTLEVVLPTLEGELPRVSLTGGLLVEASLALSVEGFVASWEGSLQPFDVSLGAALPELFNGLKGLLLHDVSLEVSFDKGLLSLAGKGAQFGLNFDVSLGLVHAAGAWDFGASFSAAGGLGLAGLPEGVVRDMLLHLAPLSIDFSIARSGVLGLPRGLSLSAFVGANSKLLATAKGLVPPALLGRIEAAELEGLAGQVANVTARGLKLVAEIKSLVEVNLYAQLAGELQLPGVAVNLRDLALAFEMRPGLALPHIGVNAALDITLGGSVHIGARGFLLLTEGSLDITLPVVTVAAAGKLLDGQLWASPFGLGGIDVVLPLGAHLSINTAGLFVTQFALVGGFQLGGASGELQVGADLFDFGRVGMLGAIQNLGLAAVVTELAGCPAQDCLGPVASVVADVSLSKFVAWLNPNLAAAVNITVGGVSVSVPAGVNVEVEELNLWGLIVVPQAHLRVSASGVEALLQAGKVAWGPIDISSTDGAAGPSFSLVLTAAEQHLVLDGRAEVLGKSVALSLALANAGAAGKFNYDLGLGLSVEVALVAHGTPLSANFSNTLSGSLQTEVLDNIVDTLTAAVLAVKGAADAKLADANGALARVYEKLEAAEQELEAARQKAAGILAGPRAALDSALASAALKKAACEDKEKRCKDGNFWACLGVPGCYTEYGVRQAAVRTAQLAFDAAEAVANGVLDVGVLAVNTQQAALGALMATVNAARGVVNAFGSLAQAVGGVLKNVLNLHSVSFTSPLTRTSAAVAFTADMTVAGARFTVTFDSQLQYTLVKDQLEVAFRKSLSASWGARIPELQVPA